MKNSIRFVTWFLIPGLLIVALSTSDLRFAVVAAVALWALASMLGPVGLINLLVVLSKNPESEGWQDAKAASLKNRPGKITSAMGWFFLALTVGLCAFLGFPVTAGFYLCFYVWARGCNWMTKAHLETAKVKTQ